MPHRLAFATLLIGAVLVSAQERFGDFETHGDVGSPKLAGSASWNAEAQEYTLTAGGVNMWAKRDEFHYAWRRLAGDFILQARVEFVGQGTDPHRKAGLIVRSTLDDDSPYADAVTHGDGLTSLQYRRTKGAITEQVVSEAKGADFLQLERAELQQLDRLLQQRGHDHPLALSKGESGFHCHRRFSCPQTYSANFSPR